MVRAIRGIRWAARGVAGLLLGIGPSGSTQGLLEKLQGEVASIAAKTRTAVVSVEDERALFTFHTEFGPFRMVFGGLNPMKDLLQGYPERIGRLETQKQEQLAHLKKLKSKSAPGGASGDEITQTEQALASTHAELAAVLREMTEAQETAQRDLEAKLKNLDGDIAAIMKRAEMLKKQYESGQIGLEALDDTNRQKANLELDRQSMAARMAEFANGFARVFGNSREDKTRQRERKLLEEDLARLTRQQEESEDKTEELLAKYSEAHPLVKQARLRQKTLESQMVVARSRLQELESREDGNEAGVPLPEQPPLPSTPPPGAGTGFSIGDGYVVTTADVLVNMNSPLVITDSGARIKAKIVGVNPDLNIGLLQLQAKADLPALNLGDSSTVEVGHFAISVGNQSGQANSVALMLVGGLRREGTSSGTHYYPRLIQIAGTVGEGTSGAPLVNARGEVIGMMVAVPSGFFVRSFPTNTNANVTVSGRDGILTALPGKKSERPLPVPPEPPTSSAAPEDGKAADKLPAKPGPGLPPVAKKEGLKDWQKDGPKEGRKEPGPGKGRDDRTFFAQVPVTSAGYAIPINELKPFVEQLRAGKLTRGWIGVSAIDLDRPVEKDGMITIDRDVLVQGVFPDSPAFRAGVQPGDVLLQLSSRPVRGAGDVREASLRARPGDVVSVVLRRTVDKKNTEIKLELKIGPRPAEVKPAITMPVSGDL